jgi:hypothetical protein
MKRVLRLPAEFGRFLRQWFVDWLRPENRKPFYVTVSLVVFCIMGLVATGLEEIDKNGTPDQQRAQIQRNDAKMKLFGFGGAIITGIFLMIRSEQSNTYQHKTSHDIRNATNDLTVNAQVAVVTADEAATKARAAVENAERAAKELYDLRNEVRSALNGGMKERLDQVFQLAQNAFATPAPGQSQFPGTMRELEQMMDNRCGTIALNAARQAVAENMAMLRAEGVLRVQT